MPWTLLLNGRVLMVLAILASIVGAGVGGYARGRSVERQANEFRQLKALAEAQARVAEIEHAKAAEIQGISNDYEERLTALSNRAAAAEHDLGRLRVRSCRDGVSRTASAAGESHAPPANGAVGSGEGSINLDRAATEIVRLGRDLDAANLRIIELQALVRSYADRPQQEK